MTTGAPKVMLGTKWPSMMSTCSQSAPWPIVSEHALPREPKSALRMEGAMNAGGAILGKLSVCCSKEVVNSCI